MDDRSRMSREAHVRFWESVGVRIPCATHLATTEGAQVAAVAAGGAAGTFLGNLAEVCAVLDGGLELVGFFFGTDKDVTG